MGRKTGMLMGLAVLMMLAGCSRNRAATPFNGKDLTGWLAKEEGRKQSKWTVGVAAVSSDDPKLLVARKGSGEMINAPARFGEGLDLYSADKFGDCRIELELMIPKGSNSGIYVMGEYEIQVFDSWGKEKMESVDMGAIYGAASPPFNACGKPGEWQSYVIEFQAPRFDTQGRKTANARFLKVELNGKAIHRNLEMPGPTPGGVTGKEAPEGPIMFQGNHGPVAYRNIRITSLSHAK